MQDNSTRSGLLWEVERILTEQKELEKQGKSKMCSVLLLENVIQVHSEQDVEHFVKWINRLEELGYQNYWEDLIATDYGIPQTRNRCFMVSIYGEYSYNFPRPKSLKLGLKDLLEKDVDKKYFLTNKQIEDIQEWDAYQKPLEQLEQTENTNISPTLTTRSGAYAAGMVLVKDDKYLDSNTSNVRHLTPREFGRLMGVKDEDISKILRNQTDNSAYHLFGDSIVTNVLQAIFKELI